MHMTLPCCWVEYFNDVFIYNLVETYDKAFANKEFYLCRLEKSHHVLFKPSHCRYVGVQVGPQGYLQSENGWAIFSRIYFNNDQYVMLVEYP